MKCWNVVSQKSMPQLLQTSRSIFSSWYLQRVINHLNNIYINFRAKAIKQETGVKARKLSFSFSLKIKNRRLMSKISSRLKKILIFWLRALFWRIFEESTSIAHNPHWVFEILLLFNGSSPQSYLINNDSTFWEFEE